MVNLDSRCSIDHDHRHGETSYCYNVGKCRCDSCRDWNANRCAGRRKKSTNLVSAVPSIRRLQSLGTRGWTMKEMSEASGVSYRHVKAILSSEPPKRVEKVTHRLIAAAHTKLHITRPTEMTRANSEMIRRADSSGWVASLGWNNMDRDKSPAVRRTIESSSANNRKHKCSLPHDKDLTGEECLVLGGCTCDKCAQSFARRLQAPPPGLVLGGKFTSSHESRMHLAYLEQAGLSETTISSVLPITRVTISRIKKTDVAAVRNEWLLREAAARVAQIRNLVVA